MQTSNDAWKIFWICYIYIGCTQPSYLHRKTLYNVRPNFEVAVRDYSLTMTKYCWNAVSDVSCCKIHFKSTMVFPFAIIDRHRVGKHFMLKEGRQTGIT